MSEDKSVSDVSLEEIRQRQRDRIKKECPELADWHQNSYTNAPADTDKSRFDAGIDAMAAACDMPETDS